MDIWETFSSIHVGWWIASAVALYFLGVPLLILAIFQQQALPTIEPVDMVDELSVVVKQYFAGCHDEFTSIGYAYEGTFFLPQPSDNIRAILAMFVDREKGCAAMSVVMYAKAGTSWTMQTKYTEFCTRFRDGSDINTSNMKEVGAFPIPDEDINTIHPKLQNVVILEQAHQSVVLEHARRRQKVLQLFEIYDGNVPGYLANSITEELEYARDLGYLKYRGGMHDEFTAAFRDPDPYRPPGNVQPPQYVATFKGAYLMTWKQLWPIKPLVACRRFSKDRRFLVESGFTG